MIDIMQSFVEKYQNFNLLEVGEKSVQNETGREETSFLYGMGEKIKNRNRTFRWSFRSSF